MPIQTYKTKVDLALDGIREAILRGDIRPGERLTLARLSELLGMSVTPIREAIRALEAEGLVTSEPHRGVKVNELTVEDAEDLYVLRAAMESLATKLAVPRLTEADIEKLESLHSRMAEAIAQRDDALLTRANADWHFDLYAASRSKYLLKHIVRLWMPFHWGGRWVAERRERSFEEHAAIMSAIRLRDAEEAARLMHEHITRAHLSIMDHLRADGGDALRGTPIGEAVFALEDGRTLDEGAR